MTPIHHRVKPEKHGDSSEFDSDQHEQYINELTDKVIDNKITLTDRDQWLIKGIHIVNMRQKDLMEKIGVKMGDAIRQSIYKKRAAMVKIDEGQEPDGV